MLDCLGKKEGIIIPRNYITKVYARVNYMIITATF